MTRLRRWTAPHPDDRCEATRSPLKDGSLARCMRRKVAGTLFCTQHQHTTTRPDLTNPR